MKIQKIILSVIIPIVLILFSPLVYAQEAGSEGQAPSDSTNLEDWPAVTTRPEEDNQADLKNIEQFEPAMIEEEEQEQDQNTASQETKTLYSPEEFEELKNLGVLSDEATPLPTAENILSNPGVEAKTYVSNNNLDSLEKKYYVLVYISLVAWFLALLSLILSLLVINKVNKKTKIK
ncbi:hypothetical protein C0584_04350 [Candidatus Parcubacteria bacterium]|nr:MAG: hypothetical protein C0584_04350 [Candidatus Parcubacteria bacterium]